MGETPPPPHPPVELVGAAHDAELGVSVALSREEVLRRRRRRLMQLYSLYRAQYWALADELRAKHCEYWWEHGASPVLPELPPRALPPSRLPSPALVNRAGVGAPVNGGRVRNLDDGRMGAPAPAAADARVGCAASNCEAKAMPLSQFCFDHIILDTKQQLYKPCAFVTRKSGALNEEVTCGKPALRSTTPLRCVDHNPKSQSVLEAFKSIGLEVPATCKSVPKWSDLISETVRQIQLKRRLSLNDVKKTSGSS